MIVTLIRSDRLFISTLPDEVTGKHWVYDAHANGARRQLASIEAVAGEWVINPVPQAQLAMPDGNKVASATLRAGAGLYHLRMSGESYSALLVERLTNNDRQFTKLGLSGDCDIQIGRKPDNHFELAGEFVSSHHALLRYKAGRFAICDLGSSNGVFVNSRAIVKQKLVPLNIGDVIFIMGMKLMVGSNFIAFNNPGGRLVVHSHRAFVAYLPQQPPRRQAQSYAGSGVGYFFRSPRLKRDIEERSFEIEDPPAPAQPEETPLLLRIGPSVGMALASCFMGLYMVVNMTSGEGNALRMLPMLFMIVMMVTGAVLWPILNTRHKRKKDAEKELLRISSYANYLDRIRGNIQAELASQKEILEENRISVAECFNRASNRDRRLFERTPVQSDFLTLRVGVGDIPLAARFRWPQERLANEGDVLRGEVLRLAREPQIIYNAPLAFSLLTNHVVGVVGRRSTAYPFLRGLLVQLLTLHAATEVKTVILCSEEDRAEWDFLFALPHAFDDGMQARYLATNPDEAAELALRLERELQPRLSERLEVVGDYGAYYVVLALDHDLAKRSELVSRLAALRDNKGFAVLSYARDIRDLPRECTRIVELDVLQDEAGRLYSQLYDPNDPTGNRPHFMPDIGVGVRDARYFALALASAQLADSGGKASQELPRSLGFLELFEAGKVEHLNVRSRWQENNPCVSLAAPVGADTSGAPFVLNIHEDYHGPHGLIAGMTGSGKSEFIIAYILSMAINYRPTEVSFVLIDYKGGGLAGAFASSKNRLPHLAGTITNLDGGAIRRSLVSIKSELKRRQDIFNQARDSAGMGTMDIYKYQELYRLGRVEKPVPHLLIISDEFAELKDQQPEFMEELVSAARIGRSLGVHLILATQKPSGVVNDQIWSNARFKVSLKVADAADSREMLKVPDAAELTDPGRFYLLVGYNEYFALGQSAYAGTRYSPSDQFVKPKDDTVVLISNTGRGLLSIKPQKPTNFAGAFGGGGAAAAAAAGGAAAAAAFGGGQAAAAGGAVDGVGGGAGVGGSSGVAGSAGASATGAGGSSGAAGSSGTSGTAGATGVAGATGAAGAAADFDNLYDDITLTVAELGGYMEAAAKRDQPEQVAVLEHLVQVAATENLQAPALWLDQIPELLLLSELQEKYAQNNAPHFSATPLRRGECPHPPEQAQQSDNLNVGAETCRPLNQNNGSSPGRPLTQDNHLGFAAAASNNLPLATSVTPAYPIAFWPDSPILSPLVGELDDPWNQAQAPLLMPLSEEGNAIIFGSTGSGKATMLATMLASLLNSHSARTLNAYLLDLGAETLGAFRDAPQVGDVLYAADEEKVDMLFRVLHAEMQRRRKLLATHDGGFLSYAATDPLPTILVVINVFEVFNELFDKYLDDLVVLSRDGLRYGIQFVLTTSRANGVPYRLLPNFKLAYVLRMNSRDDYLSILGSLGDCVPPTAYARGLVKTDRIYEMQVAQLSIDGREVEAIRQTAALAEAQAQEVAAATGTEVVLAPAVPALPDVVDIATITARATAPISSNYLPLGFTKDTIDLAIWDFRRSQVMLVFGEDEEGQARVLRGIASVLLQEQASAAPAKQIIMLDPDGLLDSFISWLPETSLCLSDRGAINEFVTQIDSYNGYLFLVSLRSLLQALDDTTKASFTAYVEKGGHRQLAGLLVSGEPSRFTSFSYESWYRELIGSGSGIWAGDGINAQTALKVSNLVPTSQASPPPGFAWLVNRGTTTLYKYAIAQVDAMELY